MNCNECTKKISQYDSVGVQNKTTHGSQVSWKSARIREMKTLCVDCAEFWCKTGKDHKSDCEKATEHAQMIYPGAQKIQDERDRLFPVAPTGFAPKASRGGTPKNGNCYASINEKWLHRNKWVPKGWKSKEVKLPKAGLRKLYYKVKQDSWPEWRQKDLPKGWKAVPSRTRPGKLTYLNKLTGERIAYYPTLRASHKPNDLPPYMPRKKFECLKVGNGGGIWYDDTCYYSQKPIGPAKKYLPPVFITDVGSYCEQIGDSKKCSKSSYKSIDQAIFGHVDPQMISTTSYPCKWKDKELSQDFRVLKQ